MPSYLPVALAGSGTLLEVQASQDGVLAETLLDGQLCFLHAPFLLTLLFLRSALFLQCLVVGEEVHLAGLTALLLGSRLGNESAGAFLAMMSIATLHRYMFVPMP